MLGDHISSTYPSIPGFFRYLRNEYGWYYYRHKRWQWWQRPWRRALVEYVFMPPKIRSIYDAMVKRNMCPRLDVDDFGRVRSIHFGGVQIRAR